MKKAKKKKNSFVSIIISHFSVSVFVSLPLSLSHTHIYSCCFLFSLSGYIKELTTFHLFYCFEDFISFLIICVGRWCICTGTQLLQKPEEGNKPPTTGV